MIIDRRKLWRASFANVLRLAKSLGVARPGDGCACVECKANMIERVARACEIDDVSRIIGRT